MSANIVFGCWRTAQIARQQANIDTFVEMRQALKPRIRRAKTWQAIAKLESQHAALRDAESAAADLIRNLRADIAWLTTGWFDVRPQCECLTLHPDYCLVHAA